MTPTISPITKDDTKCGFSCGEKARDDDSVDLPLVLGFYTLCMAQVSLTEAPRLAENFSQKPPNAFPVALIGRLAIDARMQGKGLGTDLLADALGRIVDAERQVACMGVIIDAKNEGNERLYARMGFEALTDEGWPRRMFVPTGTIGQAFRAP